MNINVLPSLFDIRAVRYENETFPLDISLLRECFFRGANCNSTFAPREKLTE